MTVLRFPGRPRAVPAPPACDLCGVDAATRTDADGTPHCDDCAAGCTCTPDPANRGLLLIGTDCPVHTSCAQCRETAVRRPAWVCDICQDVIDAAEGRR